MGEKIVLHACCAICSGYPISYLQDMGYQVIVYFYNPNIFPETEYFKRLEAQRTLCINMGCELVEGEYNPDDYYNFVKGFEDEPEKGLRCDKCFELRLEKTAEFAKSIGVKNFTTSIVISPHKNFEKLTKIGEKVSAKVNAVIQQPAQCGEKVSAKVNAVIQQPAQCGEKVSENLGINYLAIDFKKKDGFLKTNKIAKELNLYRQNYCGCKFAIR